ncbi:MAG: 2-oxoacid:acceptor oxidoreductase family protein [Clostridia bacterium]|jgi:2-oxoglutarate ferredoxin oxidoreductase subunit gamma|nr:2-oxoacid:acceptor oxidoreductase family protein [Clostridia bacterium]MBO7504601.1 2-oxoacid:acceptor oxidoreductase family protein [Clostridia bacterium]MBP5666334.1 2-oxoacid:acceptor oxidoreductase family protein [Clostridia bacterium]MBQ3894626.1 2-oxoacid:acceptor oxidoreductase family protein [Clostridia bacterium]MBR5005621.1 2-oxoacid:acceptor oxidoreductase family protein [Clostridia bacterium]
MQEIILAGFGGQGILSMGKFIAMAGLEEGKNVSWLPSYGPEMRGGTANCNVIVAEEEVGSPIVNKATTIIVMNQPSLEKFEKFLVPGGVVILDKSLVPVMPEREDVEVYAIPATEMAYEMGNATFAGIILLGKLIEVTGVVSRESFEKALYKILPPRKHSMIPDEMKALETGAKY